jgi:predicted metal-dependent hydrolase
MPNNIHTVENISFKLQRKPRLKHTYIQVTFDGVIVKTNMRTSLKEINKLVASKSAWILKHLKNNEKKVLSQKLENGSKIYFLGLLYEVELRVCEAIRESKVEIEDSKIIFYVLDEWGEEEFQELLNLFYKEQAIKHIEPMVKLWANKMNLHPTYVGYRKAKTRWGSCSAKDRISFNYYLMKLPLTMIEYVVVHELTHIEHKNHSINFWSLLEFYLPNYKSIVKELRILEKAI